MINPELTAYAAVCHTSFWRPLRDERDRPGHYVKLSQDEIIGLVQTGTLSIPDRFVPSSVRTWWEVQRECLT